MAMNRHHLSVRIELGCGCVFERRIDGEDLTRLAEERAEAFEIEWEELNFHFPSGHANMMGMVATLMDPVLMSLIILGEHEDNGAESIDIKVRTKVGELPRPEDWKRIMGVDDD